ncbi:MAG: hypothetical protein MI919_21500, partial [Holophagales bacterium]|nr:hypothetical protein [Holophagales bacterium]
MSHAIDPNGGARKNGAASAGKNGGNNGAKKSSRHRHARAKSSLFAAGEPMLWLTGGALAICSLMVLSLLLLVLWQGLSTFWVLPVVHITTPDGRVYMGEITRYDSYEPTENVVSALEGEIAEAARAELEATGGWARRDLVRTGNF